MQFTLTDDQRLLAEGVAAFLAGECRPAHVRQAWDSGRFDAGRWKALAGLGVVGLTVPERFGGLGMGDVDLVTLLVEAGRAALPEPLLEVSAVSAALLADLADLDGGGPESDEGGSPTVDQIGTPTLEHIDSLAATWLPRIAAGDAIVVPALEGDPYPANVEHADLVLVGRGNALYALPPHALEVTHQPSVDPARPTATVALPTAVAPIASGPEVAQALARASTRGTAAAAAMLVGAGHAMIELAVEYANTREQFGKPIGSFQAVKHHLATAFVEVQFCRPLVERAASSIATGDADAVIHAAMAKAMAAEAAAGAAKAALQVHGAIGYTWECDLQLWMKRVWSLSAAWGDTESLWRTLDAHVHAATPD